MFLWYKVYIFYDISSQKVPVMPTKKHLSFNCSFKSVQGSGEAVTSSWDCACFFPTFCLTVWARNIVAECVTVFKHNTEIFPVNLNTPSNSLCTRLCFMEAKKWTLSQDKKSGTFLPCSCTCVGSRVPIICWITKVSFLSPELQCKNKSLHIRQ